MGGLKVRNIRKKPSGAIPTYLHQQGINPHFTITFFLTENLGEEEATLILQQWLIDSSRCLQDDPCFIEALML